jgi:hypothetical protein
MPAALHILPIELFYHQIIDLIPLRDVLSLSSVNRDYRASILAYSRPFENVKIRQQDLAIAKPKLKSPLAAADLTKPRHIAGGLLSVAEHVTYVYTKVA